jgi:hypothetical protein
MEPEIILIVRGAESLMIEPCGASRAVIMQGSKEGNRRLVIGVKSHLSI